MRKLIGKAAVASAAFVAIGLGAASVASAEMVTYTIDPLESSLTLLGNFGGNPASQQTPGSLTTSYSGTIVADRGPGTINFRGGSSVDAAPQPVNQQPRSDGTPGAEQADYGRTGTVSLNFGGDFPGNEAFRGFNFDFDTDSDVPITLSATNTFNGNQFGTEVNSGESAWLYGGSSFGTNDFSGDFSFNNAQPSSIEVVGDVERLTLRIGANYGYTIPNAQPSNANFVGTIVATRLVPEPSAIGAVAAVGASLLARRRRNA
jgi:hypothetical protein